MAQIIQPPVRQLEDIVNAARRSRMTVEDMVCNVIREAIVSGVFRPGERLPQDHLADMLGVSRMPVRASLQQLEAEGLVEVRPYRGAVVRAFTPQEVAEVYELRILLETYALRRLIDHITDDDLVELEELARIMDAERDPARWLEHRQAFYDRLYDIAGHARLKKMIASLRAEIGRYWMTVRVIDDPQGHRQLIAALRARDADAATDWLREHLDTVRVRLQELIEAQPDAGDEP